MERRCKVCGRVLRATKGDIGPICGQTQKNKNKKSMSKKAYLRAIKKKDIFGGDNSESGKDAKTEFRIT